MKKAKSALFVMLAAALALGAPACKKEQADQPASPKLSAQLDMHFQEATSLYEKGDLEGAAAEVDKAADLLQEEASDTSGDARQLLLDGAQDLKAVSLDIKNGMVESKESLSKSYARAYKRIADSKYATATRQWAEKRYSDASDSLDESLNAMEKGLSAGGGKVEEGYQTVIARGREFVDKADTKTEKGVEAANRQWADVASSLGSALDNLGQELTEYAKEVAPEDK